MKITSKIFAAVVTLVAIISTQTVVAQTTISPYSKIGYGMLTDNASGAQRAMGGVGYAMQSGRQINAMNPASYSQVDSLTFLWDMGIDLTNLWSKENGNRGYSFGGGLDYINAMFRIYPKLGGSFGIVPYSSVGYSFGKEINDENDANHAGTGSINELYFGIGYEPLKNFSIGANVSYMFGTTSNYTMLTQTIGASYFERTIEVRDWNIHIGAQYAININPLDRVVLGVVYTPKKSLHGHRWGVLYDAEQDAAQDTVGYMSLKGEFEQPHSIGAGISYTHNNRFTGEIDFTYQRWASAKYQPLPSFEETDMKFDNRWKVAAGVSYTPLRSNNYFQRITYRMGGFYNHDYLNVRGNNVRDYGMSIGFGLPTSSVTSKTQINLGLEWRHRVSSPVTLVSENYFNITLSVHFNELWFWKNKIR